MISLYRAAGYLALVSLAAALIAFCLGHPLDGLAAYFTQTSRG